MIWAAPRPSPSNRNCGRRPLDRLRPELQRDRGTAFSGVLATFTDPNPLATPSSFTASITWGDGHSSAGTIGYDAAHKAFTVSGSNTYTQAGSYRPAISIHDLGGTSALAIATATVADAPFIATGLNVWRFGRFDSPSVVATFIDVNPAESASNFTAKINWGAGQARLGKITQPGGPGTSFLVTGTHRYSRAGMATIKVSISEKSGIPTPHYRESKSPESKTPIAQTRGTPSSQDGGFDSSPLPVAHVTNLVVGPSKPSAVVFSWPSGVSTIISWELTSWTSRSST